MNKILFFDLETTGTDIATDRIVEIGRISCSLDSENKLQIESTYNTRVNPQMMIPASAIAVHGITNESVRRAPIFADIARDVLDAFICADFIAGYNINRFDLPLLAQEFARVGLALPLDLKVIDVFTLYSNRNPRTLSAVYKQLFGIEMTDAHSAFDDTNATVSIFERLIAFDMYDVTPEETFIECATRDASGKVLPRLAWSQHFAYDANGNVIITFGKHRGERAIDCRGYLQWMKSANFPADTIAVVDKVLSGELS